MPNSKAVNRNHHQKIKTSLVITASMPLALAEIVVNYMGSDNQFMQAMTPLNFGQKGFLINPGIRLAIKEALISNFCSLAIKRQIFVNLTIDSGSKSRCELNTIFREIEHAGYVLNLDFTDLSLLKLSGLNFPPHTNCRHINLASTEIYGATMPAIDLTYANCRQTVIRLVDMTGACLQHSSWTGATLIRVNLRHASGVNLDGVKQLSRVNLDEATDDDLTGAVPIAERYQGIDGMESMRSLKFDAFDDV